MKNGGNDYQTLKALKALAKARSGVFQEAYDLAYEVKQTRPTDAPTLQAVFMTFKQVHMCKCGLSYCLLPSLTFLLCECKCRQ